MNIATPTLAQQVHAAALDVQRRRIKHALGQPADAIPSMADQVRAIAADAADRARSAVASDRSRCAVVAVRAAALRRRILELLEDGQRRDSAWLHAALEADPAITALGPITRDSVRRLAGHMRPRCWVVAVASDARAAQGLPPAFSQPLLYRITEAGHAALRAMRELA